MWKYSALFALVLLTLAAAGYAANQVIGSKQVDEANSPTAIVCTAPECIVYDISSQDQCQYFTPRTAKYGSAWGQGLSTSIDSSILVENGVTGWDIVAYRIQWFNGAWSGWYVPGVNDINWKFNTSNRAMSRVWAYFGDHTHDYIACRRL